MGPTADPIQLDPDKEPKANWFSNQENYNKNNNIYTTNNNNIFSINTLNYNKNNNNYNTNNYICKPNNISNTNNHILEMII
jgi:hypothetical protein